MSNKVTVKFYLHPNIASNGKRKVMGRIIVNRKKAEFATDYDAKESEWSDVKGAFVRNNAANEALDIIRGKANQFKSFLMLEEKEVNARAIRDLLTEREKLRYGLIEYFEKYNDYRKKLGDLSKSAMDKYIGTKKHLESFISSKKGVRDIGIKEVDYNFIYEFDGYLRTFESEQFKQPLSKTTVQKHHSRFKTIILKAFNEGLINKNPYSQFKVKKVVVPPKYLTTEELEKVENHELGGNESLKRVRDIFVFSCYTGLRFQDAQNLTADKLEVLEDGSSVLQVIQMKTKEPVFIPLLPKAIEIIERYKNTSERQVKHKLIPEISNAKLNTYLKVIQDLTGITQSLKHNIARHTFATTVLLDNDIPLEVTSKLLGHTNLPSTQIYGKITKKNILNQMKKLK